jgi:outer membrane protein OmpA-like peptidoglycan-associated protein
MLRLPHPRLAAAVAIAAALAACATTPPHNPNLTDAHLAYDAAAGDPDAVRSAPAELQRARDALTAGDAALAHDAPVADVDHYAYVARQRAASAMQAALAARADQSTAQARADRDRIVVASRTREADAQRAAAAAASANAAAASAQASAANADAMAARQQAEDARAQLAALQAKQTERGMVLTMGDVLFDTGKATLKDGAMQTLDRLAEFMNKNPNERVRIEGYTDSVGSEDMNLELSRRRANAVRDALLDRHVDTARIDIAALGERYAVASNDNAAGRQRNRRVEVVFSDANGGFNSPRS